MAVLLIFALGGCAQKEKGVDPSKIDAKLVEELSKKWKIGDDIRFDWYIGLSWWQYNKKWTEYPVLNEITQITGVTPTAIIPTGEGTEKLNLMMSTNSLPDLITISPDDSSIIDKLITQDYVYSYDELIEKFAPEFKDEIDPAVWDTSSYDDGKLYSLPCFFSKDKEKVGAQTFNVRQDIYEELGSPDMSTVDGFIGALKAFKEKYPTIEGKASIPLTIGTGFYRFMLEESFGIQTYYTDGSGNVKIRFKNPKYPEFAKFMNRLYNEKLLDPETFIKMEGGLNEDLAAGRVFCYPSTYWGLDAANATLNKNKPGSGFIAIEPLKNAENVSFPGTNSRGWMTTFISKKAKNPEAIIKFIRFMWSKEGNLLTNYGHEGKEYTIEGDTIVRSPDVVKQMANDPDGFASDTGIFTFRLFQFPYYNDAPSNDPTVKSNDEIAQKYGRDNTVFSYKMAPDAATREGMMASKVWAVYEREWPKMVMAKNETEAIAKLNEMLAAMETQGLSQVEKYWTDRYNQNVEKFGPMN